MLGLHCAREAAEAVDTKPDVESVRADIYALDQQRHAMRLLGREELAPQRIELLKGGTGVSLGDVVVMRSGRLPCPGTMSG